MVAVEIFVVLSLYIYVLFRLPEMRIAGTIVATVLIGGLVYYTLTAPNAPQAELNRISAEEVVLEDVDLVLGPRIASLTGRAINNSATYTLTGIEFDVKLYDCAADDTPLDACFIIGEDQKKARLSAPAGQLRAFNATLTFTNLPPLKGVQRWDYSVISLQAIEATDR